MYYITTLFISARIVRSTISSFRKTFTNKFASEISDKTNGINFIRDMQQKAVGDKLKCARWEPPTEYPVGKYHIYFQTFEQCNARNFI